MKNWILLLTVICISFSLPQIGLSQVISEKLEAPLKTTKPTAPNTDENQLWIPGQWKWEAVKKKYTWEYGHWAKKREGFVYIKGRWVTVKKGRYKWNAGEWKDIQNAF